MRKCWREIEGQNKGTEQRKKGREGEREID